MDFDNIGRNELIGRIQLAGKMIFFNSIVNWLTQLSILYIYTI